MDVVLDTNILLRLLDRADPQHDEIRRALRVLRGRGETLAVASQNLAEFWNVCTRPAAARGGYGLSIEETDRRLRLLERIVALLADTAAAYPQWRQLVKDHAVRGVQVHDARLVALMMAHGVTHLVTLNTADFRRYPAIVVLSPTDVLAASHP